MMEENVKLIKAKGISRLQEEKTAVAPKDNKTRNQVWTKRKDDRIEMGS